MSEKTILNLFDRNQIEKGGKGFWWIYKDNLYLKIKNSIKVFL